MKFVQIVLPVIVVCVTSTSSAEIAPTYRPLGSWASPADVAQARWNSELQARVARAVPVRLEARPQLAGMRPRNLELLEDGILRKHPRLLKADPSRARELIVRLAQWGRIPQLRGHMAEAIFVDRHPDWGYVAKSNATQHDVYRSVVHDRRVIPEGGQIKYHDSGKPSMYARDMLKDHRAARFFVPDDHVEETRKFLRNAGRWRDANRISPIGATSAEIRSATSDIQRRLTIEKYATYTSLGASLSLAFGPTIYSWARGDLAANTAAYRTAKSMSLLGVSVVGDQFLMRIQRGALRGGVQGNAIVGTAVAITETIWLIHEHGGRQAFYQPSFYEEIGGNFGAVTLGLAGGTLATGLALEIGPAAPVVGFFVGVGTGMVGYVGGRTITRALIEVVSPEMLRREESQRLELLKASLDRRINDLMTLSPMN